MNYREQPAYNLGAATTESDPTSELFSRDYVFGARVYDIEQNPGPSNPGFGAPVAPLSQLDEPVDLTLPATQEPTPAAIGGSLAAGANEKWFLWSSGVQTLVVSLPNGADIRSLWFPVVVFPVQVSPGQSPGNVMYQITTTGGELVPIPAGTAVIALSALATSPNSLWVLAAGIIYPPFKAPQNTLISASSTYDSLVIADPTLQYYWPLNDPAGTTACQDYGPSGNPIDALAGVTLGVTGLLYDGETAAFSSASDTAALMPQSPISIGRDAQTIELWVFAQGSGSRTVFDGGNGGLTIGITPANLLYVSAAFAGTVTTVLFPQNQTVYLCCTINSSVLDVYLNGALAFTVSYILDSTNLVFMSSSNNSQHLEGKIEKIAIYSGVFSLSQIREHYAAGLS